MNFIQNIEKFDSMKGERLTFSALADGRFGLVVQYKNDGYLFSRSIGETTPLRKTEIPVTGSFSPFSLSK